MVDINKQELAIGDYVLVAFKSCGYVYLEYATVIYFGKTEDFIKVRFETSNLFKTKILKQDGKSRVIKIRSNG